MLVHVCWALWGKALLTVAPRGGARGGRWGGREVPLQRRGRAAGGVAAARRRGSPRCGTADRRGGEGRPIGEAAAEERLREARLPATSNANSAAAAAAARIVGGARPSNVRHVRVGAEAGGAVANALAISVATEAKAEGRAGDAAASAAAVQHRTSHRHVVRADNAAGAKRKGAAAAEAVLPAAGCAGRAAGAEVARGWQVASVGAAHHRCVRWRLRDEGGRTAAVGVVV